MGELHSMSMAYSSNSLALGGPGGLGLGLGLGGGNNWDNCHNFNLGVLSSDRMSLGTTFFFLFLYGFMFFVLMGALHFDQYWLSLLGIGTHFRAVMDDYDAPPFSSTLESDFSTGYLEDALVEFSKRSKRRRMLLFNDDKIRSDSTASASKVLIN